MQMGTLGKMAVEEPRGRGRPRDGDCRERILRAGLELFEESSFADITTDAIAERAGASKATIYRWWPNKAELVLDAFLSVVEAELHFERGIPIRNSLRAQMIRLSRLFSGKVGSVLSAVIGAGQSEPEMLATFRRRWIEPRRIEAKAILREAMDRGEIRSELSPDAILDVLYGAIYFRFLIGRDKLSDKFVDEVLNMVLPGLTTEKS